MENLFEKQGGIPSISFATKDPTTGGFVHMPIGTKIGGVVTKLPEKAQSRKFGSTELLFWSPTVKGEKVTEKNDNPVMSVVVRLNVEGTEKALWAEMPSSMFGAICDALVENKKAGGPGLIELGGTLYAELLGYKQGEDTNKAAAKQYKAYYTSPNAFAAPAEAPAAAPAVAPPPAAVVAPPPVAAPPVAPPPAAWPHEAERAQHIAAGWTDELLVQHGKGHLIKPAAPAVAPPPVAAAVAPPPAATAAKVITREDANLLGLDDATLAAKGFIVQG